MQIETLLQIVYSLVVGLAAYWYFRLKDLNKHHDQIGESLTKALRRLRLWEYDYHHYRQVLASKDDHIQMQERVIEELRHTLRELTEIEAAIDEEDKYADNLNVTDTDEEKEKI